MSMTIPINGSSKFDCRAIQSAGISSSHITDGSNESCATVTGGRDGTVLVVGGDGIVVAKEIFIMLLLIMDGNRL